MPSSKLVLYLLMIIVIILIKCGGNFDTKPILEKVLKGTSESTVPSSDVKQSDAP